MRLAIIGAGGHGQVVLEAVRAADPSHLVEFWDADDAKVGSVVAGAYVRAVPDHADAEAVLLGIGDNATREAYGHRFGDRVGAVVHPSSWVAATAQISRGAFIAAGALVGDRAVIGEGAIVNTGAIVDHGCSIGPYAHVCPGARLAGRVMVGARAFIGLGASIIQGVTIGEDAIVGAGSVVLRSVSGSTTVVGVPARTR